MPLCYSYSRFSTPEQAKGDSKRRQRKAYTSLCQKHKLTPATAYFDEGKSAWKKGKQSDLARFLALVEAGQVKKGSWLAVESLDRVGRQGNRQLLKVLEQIIEAGVVVATTTPERVYDLKSLDDPLALMEILFIATRAKEESDTKSRRVKEAWGEKLANAEKQIVTRRCPAWLQFDEDKGRFVEIPERGKVVRQIFDWAINEGMGQRAIAKRLNSTGVKPFRTHKGNGKRWGWAYVRLILTDRKVLGDFRGKGRTVKGYYPAVIDDEATFLKVQALSEKRRLFRGNTSTRVSNLFSGLAFDVGGSSMVLVKKAADRPARFIPSCFETSNQEGAASFQYEIFETQFLDLVKDLTVQDIGLLKVKPDNRLAELETELAKLDLHIAKVKRLLESVEDSPEEALASLTTLSAKRKGLAAKRDNLRASAQLATTEASLTQSQTILEALASAPASKVVDLRLRLRQAIRGLVSRITCVVKRDGWQSRLHCCIRFQQGGKRFFSLFTRRGKLTGVLADTEKWTDKKPSVTLNGHEFVSIQHIQHAIEVAEQQGV